MERHLAAERIDRYTGGVPDLVQGGGAVGQVIASLGDQAVLNKNRSVTAGSSMEGHITE